MKNAVLQGMPDARKMPLWFDGEKGKPENPGRWSLLCKNLLIACSLTFVGCTTQLASFSVYGPDTIDLTSAQYAVDRSKKVKGVDSATLYAVVPSNAISYDEAVRKAMATKPGCVGLADMTLKRKAFWLVFGYCDFIAEGYPIVKKEGK